MKKHDPQTRERTLVRRVLRALADREASQCPGIYDLAGYLDGILPQETQDLLEGHFAACPACLDAMIEARALRAGRVAAPVGTLECIRALAPDIRHRAARSHARLQWVAAAVAALAIGVAGLTAGSRLSRARHDAEETVLAAIAFEPDESDIAHFTANDNAFSTLVPGFEENSNE